MTSPLRLLADQTKREQTAFAVALLVFLRLAQEFIPSLDEGDIAMHAMRIPSTSLTQSQAMQTKVEQTVSRFDEVAFVYSKTGTAKAAADPMPAICSKSRCRS